MIQATVPMNTVKDFPPCTYTYTKALDFCFPTCKVILFNIHTLLLCHICLLTSRPICNYAGLLILLNFWFIFYYMNLNITGRSVL